MSVEDRLSRIEEAIRRLTEEVNYIKGRLNSESTVIKYVVFPMLMILGALVGVKLAFP